MSVALPPAVPLPSPPESAPELAELGGRLTGAAFCAGVLEAHLAGPGVVAPGWLGADAAAAAGQVERTAALAGTVHDALTAAAGRIAAHAGLLSTARARIRALRAAQHDDFAVARARLAALEARYGAYGPGGSAGRAVLDELTTAERDRRRQHAAVLAEVAADAAATARALASSVEVLGGSGAPGDGGRVLTRLAAELPGWGVAERTALAEEGTRAGDRLRWASPAVLVDELSDRRLLLTAPAFAAALVRAIGPEALRRFVRWAGLAVRPGLLPVLMGGVMGAAASVAGNDPELRGVLDAPLVGELDAAAAVGLGRVADARGLPAGYRSRLVLRLAREEREQPRLRQDELEVAPAEDPLASAMAALVATGAPDDAAGVIADAGLWPVLLDREWTEGATALERLLRAAVGSARLGAVAAVTALDAVGSAVELPGGRVTRTPEADAVVLRIGPAVADLAVAHLAEVTGPVAAAEGRIGVPSVPLDAQVRQRLAGLGLVTRSPQAREAVLRGLVRTMGEHLPDLRPGSAATGQFVTGGVFAAMAFGERESIRQELHTAEERAAGSAAAWAILTAALDALPVSRLAPVRDAVSAGLSLVGPDGVPIDAFLARPATGAFQAAFAAAAATVPGLVAAGALPDPGGALDHGLGAPDARMYEASLTPAQRELWLRVITGAESGYLTVGDALGILPGRTDG